MKKINEEEFFNDFLDNNFNKIKIFDRYEYQLSKVVKLIDPVLYRTALLEYIDFMIKEGFVIEKNGDLYLVDLE